MSWSLRAWVALSCTVGGCFGGPTSDWPASETDGPPRNPHDTPSGVGTDDEGSEAPNVPPPGYTVDAGAGRPPMDAASSGKPDAGRADGGLDGGVSDGGASDDASTPDASAPDAGEHEALRPCDHDERGPRDRCVGYGCAVATQRTVREPCALDGGVRRSD